MPVNHFRLTSAELSLFKQKALHWAQQFQNCAYFHDNDITYPNNGFQNLLAVSNLPNFNINQDKAFEILSELVHQNSSWLFGFLSYDLKNQVEALESNHANHIHFPLLHFFKSEVLIRFSKNELIIESEKQDSDQIFLEINAFDIPEVTKSAGIEMKARVDKQEYISNVNEIREHIENGDVYELNYCMEFYAENTKIDPVSLYLKLNKRSPMPFSGFIKYSSTFLICASPERFLRKSGSELISQPIKGTIKRGQTESEDQELKYQLQHDEKEIAENMMIVDLVRNDLARVSEIGSVKVDELFGIYGFQHVFQMISTISSKKRPECTLTDVLKATFPMGSMTGAPKIRAMQLIEKFEKTRRGLYSGSIGYITPNQDFDFNVVIRSLQYNQLSGYLSFEVGSAITYDSVPEKEYEECMLKAQAMLEVLG